MKNAVDKKDPQAPQEQRYSAAEEETFRAHVLKNTYCVTRNILIFLKKVSYLRQFQP